MVVTWLYLFPCLSFTSFSPSLDFPPVFLTCHEWNNTDYTGQKFGRLTVIGRDNEWSHKSDGTRFKAWVLWCDCGKITKLQGAAFTSGHRTSCGCNKYRPCETPHPSTKPDITGQRFGMLLVLGKNENSVLINGRRTKLWRCQCDCGNIADFPRIEFDRGDRRGRKSCGCLGKNRKGRVDNKRRPDDIKGQRFGNLVAIEMLPDVRECNSAVWKCQCDCGNVVNFHRKRLSAGVRLNCGDKTKHQFYLKYPPAPTPLPEEAWEIVKRYLVYTKAEYKSEYKSQSIEDEKVNRLLRAAWILYWRRSQGEELDELFERRYIWKYLRFAKAAIKDKSIREKRGSRCIIRDDLNQIGMHMTNLTLAINSEGNLSCEPISFVKKKRYKFKTC